MGEIRFPSREELEARLATIAAAPRESGVIDMIVRRPVRGEREVLAAAGFDGNQVLLGDRWCAKPPRNVAEQLTLMCTRAIAAFAGERERWPLAGDQLYVDLDLSEANLPPGTRLAV